NEGGAIVSSRTRRRWRASPLRSAHRSGADRLALQPRSRIRRLRSPALSDGWIAPGWSIGKHAPLHVLQMQISKERVDPPAGTMRASQGSSTGGARCLENCDARQTSNGRALEGHGCRWSLSRSEQYKNGRLGNFSDRCSDKLSGTMYRVADGWRDRAESRW